MTGVVKNMVDTIYSIGYAGFSIRDFTAALRAHGISLVVDVRSQPVSGRFPEYNKEALERTLRANGIYYRNYAAAFGARQEDKRFYCAQGYLDFALFARSAPFLQGVDRLCEAMRQGYTVALLCAEKKPIDCHRAILVARAFFERGYKVIHLLPDGQSITQETLHQQLLEKYFPDRDQLTLFADSQDEAALLESAYRQRNAAIGYRMEETE